MKQLSQFKLTVEKGKITNEEKVDQKPVADSVADELSQQAKEFNPKALDSRRIHTVYLWREEEKKKGKKE